MINRWVFQMFLTEANSSVQSTYQYQEEQPKFVDWVKILWIFDIQKYKQDFGHHPIYFFFQNVLYFSVLSIPVKSKSPRNQKKVKEHFITCMCSSTK